jgi:hypothetical protein
MSVPGEAAAIGLVDSQTGQFEKVAETHAWNLQQGAMLHWNPLNSERQIIYNDQKNDDIEPENSTRQLHIAYVKGL